MSQNNNTVIPVVLCGGSGTRLWPLSRTIHPKQLLPLFNEKTMLQNTLARVQGVDTSVNPIVICNQEYRFLVAEQLRELGLNKVDIILEPEGRNTAPAVAVAALHLKRNNQDPILLVMPADHVIKDREQLMQAVAEGVELANQGMMVTFGINPNKPETGYGYIQKGERLKTATSYQAQRFVEKPSLEKARDYLASGNYCWNSGMFLFRASTFLAALEEFAPDILQACEQAMGGIKTDLDFYRLNNEFLFARNESIDYAVMEKANNIAIVPLTTEWSDVGSWDVLWQISQKDADGNVLRGQVITEQVSNSYLRAEKRLLAVTGVSDLVVVETSDSILVSHKDTCQNIKTLVGKLKDTQREEAHAHDCVHRPWGYYESLNKSEHYQVKHIVVKPGAKLSLQLHQQRAEHWVMIKGTATVTRGEEEFELTANQSIYIPTGVKHRMANNTNELIHFIEVQTGDYFGEDDIVRFEDVYGRKEKLVANT